MKSPLHQNPPTVRFWQYLNHGFVRIKLKPGQKLTWSKSERTDEGYSWEGVTWEYTDGGGITCNWGNGGRDCDGPISRTGESFCLIENLASRDPLSNTPLPAWEETRPTRVTDTFAQQMGY